MYIKAWTQNVAHHKALQRAGCASVVHQQHIIVFGGRHNGTFYLDCWSYDTASSALARLGVACTGSPRAYHSATLVGDVVWLIGGAGTECCTDVWCFNLKTREWKQPTLSGEAQKLLRRTAHGACLHPTLPATILIFGGYSASADAGVWLHDLVTVDTVSGVVKQVTPRGALPEARAYHTFTAVGRRCFALFGRCQNQRLVAPKQAVAVYDAASNRWILPGQVGGDPPPALRSSHRACAVDGGVLIFGGAPVVSERQKPPKGRLADVHLLTEESGALAWKICSGAHLPPKGRGTSARGAGRGARSEAAASGQDAWPTGRAAHAQEVVNGRLFVLGGYADEQSYTADAWCTPLVDAPLLPTSPASAAVTESQAAAAVVEWRSSRRTKDSPAATRAGPLHSPAAAANAGAAAAPAPELPASKRARLTSAAMLSRALATDNAHLVDRQTSELLDACAAPVMVTAPPLLPLAPMAAPIPGGAADVLARRVRELEAALQQQRSREAGLMQTKGDLKTELESVRKELAATDSRWRQAAADCAEWKKVAEEAQEKALSASSKLRDTLVVQHGQQLEDMTRQRDAHAAARSAAEEALQGTREAAKRQAAELVCKQRDLEKGVEAAQEALRKATTERNDLQEQNAVLQRRAETAAATLAQQEGQIRDLQAAVEAERQKAGQERARLQQEVQDARQAAAEVRSGADATQLRLSAAEAALQRVRSEADDLQERLNRAEKAAHVAREEQARLRREVTDVQLRLQRAEEDMALHKSRMLQENSTILAAAQRQRNWCDVPGPAQL